MSLEDWLREGLLTEHRTSRQEVGDLLAAVERDLQDCEAEGLSADWRLAIAHNAVRGLATLALAAEGYRPLRTAHHYRVVQSLAHTVGAESGLIRELDALRKKRNLSEYERAGAVSNHEADRAVVLARELHGCVREWLSERHAELVEAEAEREPEAADE